MKIISGDIGGTNARLMLVDITNHSRVIEAEKNYHTSDFSKLSEIIKLFIDEHNIILPVFSVCLAVAGPVISGVATITNLSWRISEAELKTILQTKNAKLINDFIAVAYAIPELKDTDILTLHKGSSNNKSNAFKSAAVVGAGTGLGAAHLIFIDGTLLPLSSEAGHAGFAPENSLQTRLLSWMLSEHNHVSLEMILSGKGLVTIYQFLKQVEGIPESVEIQAAMLCNDSAQVISDYGKNNKDLLCQKTLECFVEIYGAAAGNIVLHYLPVDNLYIAGGIAGKIINKISEPRFLTAFFNKGMMSANMRKISVNVVLQDKAGLYGALAYGISVFG